MRKLLLVMFTVALLVAAAPVFASTATSAATTKSCGGQFKLHAHGLSCKAAKKSLAKGSQGYTCKQVGHSTKPPFTVKCKKNKHPKIFYTYQTQGG
jgi:hypothetical protein